MTRGIHKLRLAISGVVQEAIQRSDRSGDRGDRNHGRQGRHWPSGARDGHPGDVVFVPDPTYPIHTYSVVIAGGDLRTIPLLPLDRFMKNLSVAIKTTWPQPKMLILSFPNNPTTEVVDLDFFKEVVKFAKEHDLMVIHDFAYADLVFDGYRAPSFLQVDGAKDVGVEFFSLSKSYSMPGWRVGFAVGNAKMIDALAEIKSYFDYGVFQPIQIASITALNEEDTVCHGDCREVQKEKRYSSVRGSTGRMADTAAEGDHVCLGEDPGEFASMGSIDFPNYC